MPIEKWYRGRRIAYTKRRGDLIFVKLARRSASEKPEWIALTLDQYQREVIKKYHHDGGDSNDSNRT